MLNKNDFISLMGETISEVIDKPDRLYFNVKNENLHDVVEYLFKKLQCRLSTATAMERYHWIEVQYHFSQDDSGQYYCPRVIINDKENPIMNSISPIVKGAEWIEREMSEYWGIKFIGHPRPEPLLTRNHPNAEERKNQLRFRRVNHE